MKEIQDAVQTLATVVRIVNGNRRIRLLDFREILHADVPRGEFVLIRAEGGSTSGSTSAALVYWYEGKKYAIIREVGTQSSGFGDLIRAGKFKQSVDLAKTTEELGRWVPSLEELREYSDHRQAEGLDRLDVP